MSLSPLQILAIVVLIYYILPTAVSAWFCFKLGLGKHWGWLALLVLCLLRITGSALRLAAHDENSGVARAARYLPAIGTVTILLVVLELLQQLRSNLPSFGPFLNQAWSVLHWSQLVAFILSIIGASLNYVTLLQAAVCIIAAIFVMDAGLALFFLNWRKHLSPSDRRISILIVVCLPFLAVRVLYAVLSAFGAGNAFHTHQPSVYTQAFMQYLMEFILVPIFLVAGNIIWRTKAGLGDGSNDKFHLLPTK